MKIKIWTLFKQDAIGPVGIDVHYSRRGVATGIAAWVLEHSGSELKDEIFDHIWKSRYDEADARLNEISNGSGKQWFFTEVSVDADRAPKIP